MFHRVLSPLLAILGVAAVLLAFFAIGRPRSPRDPFPDPELTSTPRPHRKRRWLWRLGPIVGAFAGVAAAFAIFAYPAIFPPALDPPAAEYDPAEGKVWLDSEVVIELRGNLSEEEVLQALEVSPGLDLGPDDIRLEVDGPPLQSNMPWATTRVIINPERAPLFEPETEYQISVRDQDLVFETITVPEVLYARAAADDGDGVDVPTTSPITIAFNEEIVWNDDYLTITPEVPLTIATIVDARGQTIVTATPQSRFENSTFYALEVHPGVRDVHNHAGGDGYSYSFATWAQPNILSSTPTGMTQPVDQPLRIEFQRPPDRAAVEASLAIDPPINGAPAWESDTVLLYNLGAPLPYSTAYTVSVAGLDTGGDSFVPHGWSFRTQDPPIGVDVRGALVAPTLLEASAYGGLGSFSYQWSTGHTGQKALVNVPFGETWTIDLRVTSGDQTIVKQMQVAGFPYLRSHIPTDCPGGYEMVAVSVCYREEALPGPVRTYVARIDPRDPDLEITSAPAAGTLGAKQTVSGASAAFGGLVAVNGDFFQPVPNGYVPVGPVITDGSITQLDWRFDAAFAMSRDGKGWAVHTSALSIGLAGDGGTVYTQDVNGIPPANGVGIFNSWWGSRLDLPWDGCWATMVPAATYTLTGLDFTCGRLSGIPLPANRLVIVAREGAAEWLERSVASPIYLIDPGGFLGLDFLVGGSHVLLDDGQPQLLGGLHQGTGPRTAIGVDAAGFLYMVVVDGRSEASGGMTMPQLQTYVGSLGLTDAINLDGGGSAEFTLFNAVRNVPSDGNERPVAGVIAVHRPRSDCAHPLVRCN